MGRRDHLNVVSGPINPDPYLVGDHLLSSFVETVSDQRQLIKVKVGTQSYLWAFCLSTVASLPALLLLHM